MPGTTAASRAGRRCSRIPARICTSTASARRGPGARWATSPCASLRSSARFPWRSRSAPPSASAPPANPSEAGTPSKGNLLKEKTMSIALRIACLLLACASLPLAAADRRDARPVAGFDAIALSAPVYLTLVQGDSEALVLEGDESDLAEIETVVENGTLRIRTREKWGSTHFKSKVRGTLNAKNVRSLSIAGSGDITSAALRGADLGIAISGSGDVRVATASYANVNISISGSGDVTLGGKTEKVGAHIAGSGDVKAGALEAREVKVSIAG